MEFETQNAKLSNVGSYSKASNNIISFTYSNNFDKIQNTDVYEAIDYSIVEPINQDGNTGSEFSIFDGSFSDTFSQIFSDLFGAKETKYVLCALSAFGVGVISVAETLLDAGATIVGLVASIVGNELLADDIKYAVSQNMASDLYEDCVDSYEIDDEMAYGTLYKVSNILGSMAPYVLLNVFGAATKAAKVVKIGVEGLSAAGSANQQAFEGGGSYGDSLICGVVAGVAGLVAGKALDQVGVKASSVTSVGGVIGYTSLGAAVSGSEPLVNTGVQYVTYAKDAIDENGNKKYDNLFDYYIESGGIMQTGIACAIGGFSTGYSSFSNYNKNLSGSGIDDDTFIDIYADENMSWDEYYKKVYGSKVEHISGSGIDDDAFIDKNSNENVLDILMSDTGNKYSAEDSGAIVKEYILAKKELINNEEELKLFIDEYHKNNLDLTFEYDSWKIADGKLKETSPEYLLLLGVEKKQSDMILNESKRLREAFSNTDSTLTFSDRLKLIGIDDSSIVEWDSEKIAKNNLKNNSEFLELNEMIKKRNKMLADESKKITDAYNDSDKTLAFSDRLASINLKSSDTELVLTDYRKNIVTTAKSAESSVIGIESMPGACKTLDDYYYNNSQKNNGGLNSRVTSEFVDYVKSKFKNSDGSNTVSSIYANDNLRYTINAVGEGDSYKLQIEMYDKVPMIEVDMSNKSFGRINSGVPDRQFVSPKVDSDELFKNITKTSNINVQETVGNATGLPTSGNERLTRVSLNTDLAIELHCGTEAGSCKEALSGGLPVYEIDGVKYRMTEGTIESIDLSKITSQDDINKLNYTVDNFDPITGELISTYKLKLIDGKEYLVLQEGE